jgi:ABC-2 type transport system ATP-binding protein
MESLKFIFYNNFLPSFSSIMFALDIQNLTKTYDNGYQALKGIDLKVQKGCFFGLLGANGAGKSTTINIISHLIPQTSGKIIINGFQLDKQTYQAKASIGIVPQEFNLPVFETVENILIHSAGYHGITRSKALPKAHWLLNELGLGDKKNSTVYELSGGMKRRLMIARSLIHQPELLILDEPSAGVDVEIRHSIWQFLKNMNQAGTSIILTTHYLEEAEQLCDEIAIIHHGKIVEQASVEDLLKNQTKQTLVIHTQNDLPQDLELTSGIVKMINKNSFEIEVLTTKHLNDLFLELHTKNHQIQSVSPKTNRLEALFMELIRDEH